MHLGSEERSERRAGKMNKTVPMQALGPEFECLEAMQMLSGYSDLIILPGIRGEKGDPWSKWASWASQVDNLWPGSAERHQFSEQGGVCSRVHTHTHIWECKRSKCALPHKYEEFGGWKRRGY